MSSLMCQLRTIQPQTSNISGGFAEEDTVMDEMGKKKASTFLSVCAAK